YSELRREKTARFTRMDNRRDFIKKAAFGAASLASGGLPMAEAAGHAKPEASRTFQYRIAFGAWMNDMRCEPLPLENWPAPQFDDECVRSLIRIMDLQSKAGYNLFDVWGLFATYGWPVDITSAVDKERRKRINTVLKAAKERGIKLVLGLGTYSWGYDKIIAADPAVR